MDVIFLIFAFYVAVVQSAAIIWMTKPYIQYQEGKQYGRIILLSLLVLHDYFWSIFENSGKTGLMLAEVVCYYLLVYGTLTLCCKKEAYRNLISLFSLEFSLYMVGTVITFPFYLLLSRFDLESIGLFLDKPSVFNVFLHLFLNVIGSVAAARFYGFLYRRMKEKSFKILQIILTFCDLFTLFVLGWKAITIALLLMVVLIFWSYRQQNQYEQTMRRQYAYYQSLEEAQRRQEKEVSEIRHDISNHLSVMEEMERDNVGREILQRIDKKEMCFTGIPVLDCLIREKETLCREKGIVFSKHGILFRDTSVPEYDLVSLFANLLDNAIEAAEQTPRPEITLSIQRQQGFLRIALTNTKLPDQTVKNGFQTTKKDQKNHGIGSRIIQKIVSAHDGRVTYEEEPEQMTVVVMLGM